MRGLPEKADAKEMDKYRGASVGVVVQYENGYVLCPDYNNAAVFDNDGKLLRKFGNPALPKVTEKVFWDRSSQPLAVQSPNRSVVPLPRSSYRPPLALSVARTCVKTSWRSWVPSKST